MLDEQAAKLLSVIHAKLDELGVESVKTANGTAFKTTKDFVGVREIEEFREFLSLQATGGDKKLAGDLLENFPWHFFTKAVSKDAVKNFMAENEGVAPEGINYDQQIEIQIRK